MTEPASIAGPTDCSPLRPPLPSPAAEALRWRHLYGSSLGLALAEAARAAAGVVAVMTADTRHAQEIEEELRFYAGDDLPILTFPDWESLPYDRFSPHPDIVSQRLATLARLPGLTRGVLLTGVRAALTRVPPKAHVLGQTFALDVGARLDLDAFRARLTDAGYYAVSQVMQPGEFAVRGGLLDVYPMGSAGPLRIDLFDDVIDSIRRFDPENQLSQERLDHFNLLPAREYPLTPEGIQRFRQGFRARFEGDPQRSPVYSEASKGSAPPGIEYYLPLFFEHTATLFDYLPARALVVADAEAAAAASAFAKEAAERYELLRHDRERPLLPPEDLFLPPAALTEQLAARPCIHYERPLHASSEPPSSVCDFATAAPPALSVDPSKHDPYAPAIEYVRGFPGRVLVVAETAGRREVLRGMLREHGLEPVPVSGWAAFLAGDQRLALTVAEFDKGLVLANPALAVITEAQLYGSRVFQRRRRQRGARDPEAIIQSLSELKPGDAVVHDEHGVGRYLGLQTLKSGDIETEFLALEYAGGDKLYIPVTSLHLITRYTGTDPEHAPLHKLGSDAWDKAKQRAREKAHDAAVELLELYALRAARSGHAFATRDPHYAAFAATFPFEETPDQIKVIDEVLADMERDQPMDRLVCGDVGFGKTEVAMRAAFLAVRDRRQVAVLVPTTLLAQQHFENFRDRFAEVPRAADDGADAPVRIELLSRFRSKAEQDKTLARLRDGEVDIVIGTHRLIQPDVRFKHLGLVIIDEEHRFGVRQKERLKSLRAEVDVLTLTATPIPRTLNFAFAGLRDISLIATPPQERLAIKTFVTQWNDGLIREACVREMHRGGQVYFLHNDVKTMDRRLADLKRLLPEADIRVAHGQMPERELEQVMTDFYHQRFNVLLCSTIIETGIDVPSANTIVIERADKFGLAQLHQLRGRVGRSRHRAYAYLLVPPAGVMSADAHKRLEALASLEDLGAGFALASHDLEIRGAGELLGESQSGQIDEVGFTLYTELLNRAVASLRAAQAGTAVKPEQRLAEIDLHVPALLPPAYLPDPHLRLILYKRIASAADERALEDLKAEIIDRFGPLPEATETLFRVTQLKLAAAPLDVRRIEAGPKGARIEFHDKPDIDQLALIRLLRSAPRVYRLDGPQRLRITQDMPDAERRLNALREVLTALRPAREEGAKDTPRPAARGGTG